MAPAMAAALALAWVGPACAIDTKVSGRVTFGASVRTESADPRLLVSINAAAMGLTGFASGGQNTDDANNNFRSGDVTSRVLKGYVDLSASEGAFSAVMRIKAWHDYALSDHGRPWGNSINGYAAGQALSDQGVPRQSRFSSVALSDAYIQHSAKLGSASLFGRLGQQTLAWGDRSSFAGGLSAINANDSPAMRRPGAVWQEMRVPAPMVFSRLGLSPALAIEAFYQTKFRPTALDTCGTFWAGTDYMVDGCDVIFAGSPASTDPARLVNGLYLKREPNPTPVDDSQFGAAMSWKSAALATDFGLYFARYTWRTPMPGVRKSSRGGVGLIAGNPDGKNMTFFTEYIGGVDMFGLTFAHKRSDLTLFGELAIRPHQPVQLPPGDTMPAFLNPAIVAMGRNDADAVAPGGLFHANDRMRTTQLQLGMQRDWKLSGGVLVSGGAEVVGKYASNFPDPAVRRYGRADQFGTGPVYGKCTAPSIVAEIQCSMDGYATAVSMAYRLRLDARVADVMPGLAAHASALFNHDVKGWSYDYQLNEGRRSLALALRFDYQQRYVAEVSFTPMWGGRYNNVADRDQAAMSVGIRF